MPAGDGATRIARDGCAAAEHLGEQVEVEHGARPADEVDRQHALAAHRPHVGHGVRGDDAPPVVRVVDDRREEVGGADHRPAAVEPHDRRVVAVGADEQVRATGQVDPGQEPLELADRHLAGAAAARRVLRHPHRHGHHPSSTSDTLTSGGVQAPGGPPGLQHR